MKRSQNISETCIEGKFNYMQFEFRKNYYPVNLRAVLIVVDPW